MTTYHLRANVIHTERCHIVHGVHGTVSVRTWDTQVAHQLVEKLEREELERLLTLGNTRPYAMEYR